MPTTYLFRIDMNKDNDAFFNARKSSASQVYAGVGMGIGSSSDWIPDLVEIVIDEQENFTLRLIELEGQKSSALISSRKYLPENSTKIVSILCDYLERVIRACRSSADSREDEFARLKTKLSKAETILVTSAGALRSALEFLEELPLLDQPKVVAQKRFGEKAVPESTQSFSGTLRLSREKAAALGRTVLILDAVIRQRDHSDATFKTWRAQDRSQPLKKLLKSNDAVYPCLRAFLTQKGFAGTRLDFEKLLIELTEIWSTNSGSKMNQENVRNLINHYFLLLRRSAVRTECRRFLKKHASSWFGAKHLPVFAVGHDDVAATHNFTMPPRSARLCRRGSRGSRSRERPSTSSAHVSWFSYA